MPLRVSVSQTQSPTFATGECCLACRHDMVHDSSLQGLPGELETDNLSVHLPSGLRVVVPRVVPTLGDQGAGRGKVITGGIVLKNQIPDWRPRVFTGCSCPARRWSR